MRFGYPNIRTHSKMGRASVPSFTRIFGGRRPGGILPTHRGDIKAPTSPKQPNEWLPACSSEENLIQQELRFEMNKMEQGWRARLIRLGMLMLENMVVCFFFFYSVANTDNGAMQGLLFLLFIVYMTWNVLYRPV